ncbi:MAG TPA: NAD-dependent epimerase/dehydratase family protein [bacterium]|nr:NAD-dependent epimerase/dehydratase family protein [bacterium]
MRILVTGGAGFIASHIVDAYLAAGHEVAVLDNLSTGRRENLNPRATLYEGDICFHDQVQKVFDEVRPEVVNHHAAQLDVRLSLEQPAFDATVNILGTINLLTHAARCRTRRFIFASSGGVLYGECEQEFPASERAPLCPISPYGFSKQAGEQYLRFFTAEHGLEGVALRYANVYGPRQRGGEAGVITIFCQALLAGKTPTIFGDGQQVRDYVCVSDVVAMNLKVLERGMGAYNVGTGTTTSVNALFAKLRALAESTVEVQYAPARSGELQRNALNAERAWRELEWQPLMKLDDGLRQTFDFCKLQRVRETR